MIAYGKLHKDAMVAGFSESKLGFEFSGLRRGAAGAPARRVMGIAKHAIATRVDAPPFLVRPDTATSFHVQQQACMLPSFHIESMLHST